MPDIPEANPKNAALCAAHGLRYDPAQHSGCVVCRREAAAKSAPALPATPPRARIPIALLLIALACPVAFALLRAAGMDAQALVAFAREFTGQAPPALASAPPAASFAPSTPPLPATPELTVKAQRAQPRDEPQPAQASECARSAQGLDAASDVTPPPASALQRAAASGDLAKIAEEIAAGARVDETDASGRTPLAWAVLAGQRKAARALIEQHANPNLAGRDELTPLMLAASGGAPELVGLLLEHGARPGAVDAHARTALMLAARANHAEAISVLLQHGAALEARCERGMTALQHAAESCECIDSLQRLLAARAEVDARDMAGASALMLAAQAGHRDLVSSLIDRDARLDLRDHRGLGVVDYVIKPRENMDAAQRDKLFAVLQLLIDHDPDPQLGLDPSATPILFRAQLDEWARARGRPALAAYAPPQARAQPEPRAEDSHAVQKLFTGFSPLNSRLLPTWLYQECSINFRGFLARVPNIVQQVRISGLGLRSGQQITLSSDAAGNADWEVDDAILIERIQGFMRADSAFVGRADAVWLAQQPVRRLGVQAYRYSRGAVDFTPWLATGSGVDRVLVSVLDYGGSAAVTDIYLHVDGPHAAGTLRDLKIETLQPK